MMLSLARSHHARRFISPRLIDTGDGEQDGAGAYLTLRIG